MILVRQFMYIVALLSGFAAMSILSVRILTLFSSPKQTNAWVHSHAAPLLALFAASLALYVVL
ncbi:MAG: hypothetical protein KGH49_02175 [Candidatus Micrarchaeota archaeon]|nr:hypothetical protein [Candidatus Micrarchaeota archaeon]